MPRTILFAAPLVFALATPVLAEPEFVPGTPGSYKFAWMRTNYPLHCRAPMPNISYYHLKEWVQDRLASATKEGLIEFIRTNCGSDAQLAAYLK